MTLAGCARDESDKLDRTIATMLAADARLFLRKIAAALGLMDGIVRGGVTRLQGAGLVRLMLQTIKCHADIGPVATETYRGRVR